MKAARDYVCVRITNINEIDLSRFPFDYDLTMAFLLAHPDGTVYHRYGGRADVSPMNVATLIDVLNKGVATHREYSNAPRPPGPKDPWTIRGLVRSKLKGIMKPVNGCYHCHYVREANQYLAVRDRTWTPDHFWIWPLPERIGLELDQDKQYRVQHAIAGSAAAVAGLRAGDVLRTLAGNRVLTKYDIQWVLENASSDAVVLTYSALRRGEITRGTLRLDRGWKIGDPRDYDWRVDNVYTEHMRKYLPTPGLIGDWLTGSALADLDLPSDGFALRVTHANYGAHVSGIRRGDVVLGAGNRSDFKTPRDFYHWCEMMRLGKKDIKLELLRRGSRMSARLRAASSGRLAEARAPSKRLRRSSSSARCSAASRAS